MLEQSAALDGPRLDAIEALAARVVAHDGGRLKLEPAALARERWPRALWWRDGQLVGFAGVYSFGAEPEIAGMVDPLARRLGIARAVLTDLVPRACAAAVLLVCPRTTGAGAAFAQAAGAVFAHSEHALHLLGEPVVRAVDEATTLRPARAGDLPAIAALLDHGFGLATEPNLDSTDAEQLVVERDGAVVGYLRASLHGDEGGVHGFVIAPSLRGQGIGRDVLGRTCARLYSRGATRIGLEVAVDNESALGLYTSLGFVPVVTEDYYRLTAPDPWSRRARPVLAPREVAIAPRARPFAGHSARAAGQGRRAQVGGRADAQAASCSFCSSPEAFFAVRGAPSSATGCTSIGSPW